MITNKLYSSILPVLLIILFPVSFVISNSVVTDDNGDEFPKVISPCSSSSLVNTNSESNISSDDDCMGEYLYCGDGDFKCIRLDDGLFACCDQYPETCPDDDPVEN